VRLGCYFLLALDVVRYFVDMATTEKTESLDLRGFDMTVREAARWIDAMDRPDPEDSHPTAGEILMAADKEDLLRWSRAHRYPHDARTRLRSALYLAAWRARMHEEIAARGRS
jgi:hypothetical protein